ncbi:hypothetical protein EYC80_002917 [Monilinia laxa]|uniref:Uncharacterized protein n=1 Tax=Monilinia laxa TaxID=61186 RepID=A0A5N6KC28_MONLA|nr:hypothetical protein EYC80_002917 [Monilinia laxa]
MGIGLSIAHNLMGSIGAVPAFNKHSSHIGRLSTLELRDKIDVLPSTHIEQASIATFIPSLLVPSIQNLAFLATLSTLGLYTPAFVGIGIMTSNVQALLGNGGGLSATSSWKPSKLDQRRRRAHPRDVQMTVPEIEDRNSYHIVEVLVKKFENVIRYGGRTELESYDLSTNSDDQLHAPNSDLKIRQNGNTVQPKEFFLISRESQIQGIGNKSLSTAGSLARRDGNLKQFWENFKHACWGVGMQWNGKDCGDE